MVRRITRSRSIVNLLRTFRRGRDTLRRMNTDRRSFLGAAFAAAVLPRGGKGVVCQTETVEFMTQGEFPLLLLELCGKYRDEAGELRVTHLTSRRIVTVDLSDENDWGDVNSFWDGRDMSLGLGDDEHGYWKIIRAFEIIEPTMDLHEEKFPVSYELSLEKLSELIGERVAATMIKR